MRPFFSRKTVTQCNNGSSNKPAIQNAPFSTWRTYISLVQWMAERSSSHKPERNLIMKRSHKTAAGIAAALSLGIAVAAFAHPGPMGDGNGPHGNAAMRHGKMGAMQHGAMGHGAAGMGAGHSLMTPEERTALQGKMRNAKTPEERQKLAQATREEMQKRAKEKGITLEHRGDTHTH
jgi:hypothetical protein